MSRAMIGGAPLKITFRASQFERIPCSSLDLQLSKKPDSKPVFCRQVAEARKRILITVSGRTSPFHSIGVAIRMKKSKEKEKNFHFLPIFEKLEFVKAKHVFNLFLFRKNDLEKKSLSLIN